MKVANNMSSKFLDCLDKETNHDICEQQFELTEGEEKFFIDKGLTIPKRCKPCRQRKKQQAQERADRNDE